jgi:hypothetical protein
MVRYAIAAVIGCAYIAGSMWVVSSEGRSYREGLSKQKPAATTIAESAPRSTEASDIAAPANALAEIASHEPESSTPKHGRAKTTKGTNKRATPKAHPAPPSTELASAEPVTPHTGDRAPAKIAPTHIAKTNAPARDPSWDRPEMTKSWDLSTLSARDERRLGADFHSRMVELGLIDNDSPYLSRVEDAAEPFLSTLQRKDIRYKFFIVKSEAVFAFASPGGYVYVSRGLFEYLISEDEDYALQFAIGHEIAHVDLKHAMTCLRDPDIQKMSGGTAQKLFLLIVPLGYLSNDNVDQEFEADQWVMNKMQRFGRTRREILLFLLKLDGYAERNGFRNGRAAPAQGMMPLENHYRAKTAARKRLKHLKELMEPAAASAKKT